MSVPAIRKWSIGNIVLTVKPEQESKDWNTAARRHVQWNEPGVIVDESNAHGLVFEVLHLDGHTAWYEPRELAPR